MQYIQYVATQFQWVDYIFGASEAKPLFSGWCETGSSSMSHLISIYGMYVALCNSLPYMVCTSHCTIVYHIWYVCAATLHNTIHSAQVHAFFRLKPSQESAMPPAFSILPTSSCSLSLKLNQSSHASHTYDSAGWHLSGSSMRVHWTSWLYKDCTVQVCSVLLRTCNYAVYH